MIFIMGVVLHINCVIYISAFLSKEPRIFETAHFYKVGAQAPCNKPLRTKRRAGLCFSSTHYKQHDGRTEFRVPYLTCSFPTDNIMSLMCRLLHTASSLPTSSLTASDVSSHQEPFLLIPIPPQNWKKSFPQHKIPGIRVSASGSMLPHHCHC